MTHNSHGGSGFNSFIHSGFNSRKDSDEFDGEIEGHFEIEVSGDIIHMYTDTSGGGGPVEQGRISYDRIFFFRDGSNLLLHGIFVDPLTPNFLGTVVWPIHTFTFYGIDDDIVTLPQPGWDTQLGAGLGMQGPGATLGDGSKPTVSEVEAGAAIQVQGRAIWFPSGVDVDQSSVIVPTEAIIQPIGNGGENLWIGGISDGTLPAKVTAGHLGYPANNRYYFDWTITLRQLTDVV